MSKKIAKATKTRKMELAEMLEKGLVNAGQKIHAFYAGREFNGTILADATVRVGRQVFASLSAAGRSIVQAHGPKDGRVCGYTFFGTKNAEGQVVSIDSLRQ